MFGSKLMKGRSAAELLEAEKTLEARRRELIGQLDAAQSEVGAAALDSVFSGATVTATTEAKRVATLNAEIAGVRSAIEGVRQQRSRAIAETGAAEATNLREQVAACRASAQKLAESCRKPLATLSALEGVVMDHPTYIGLLGLVSDRRVLEVGGLQPVGRSYLLTAEIEKLEQSAKEAEQRQIRAEGEVVGTLDEILGAIFSDPTTLHPVAEEIRDWAERVEWSVRANEPQHVLDIQP